MPFTPYHLGPGLLFKGVAPRHCSWTAYAAAQVAVDTEALVYLLRGEPPFHRELHSLAGAALVGTLVALLLLGLRLAGKRILPAGQPGAWRLPASLRAELASPGAIWVGASLGGMSHVLIDSLVYPEIRLFWPFPGANPFFGRLSDQQVTGLCVSAGVLGLMLAGLYIYLGIREQRQALQEEAHK